MTSANDLFDKLLRQRKDGKTPNVPVFDRQPYNDGRKTVAPAGESLRSLSQNIIDQVHEHRHLRKARVLLITESSEAAVRKLQKGERMVIGRAYRSSPIQRVLSADLADTAKRKKSRRNEDEDGDDAAILPGFDFIVKLSGDWLMEAGYFAGVEEGIAKAAALIDHELLHCGVKIAGQFIERDELDEFVEKLGQLHVETCEDIVDDENRVLVRYQVRDEKGEFVWKLRRHDLEEFCGVVRRWGAWDRDVARLVDVIVDKGDTRGFSMSGLAGGGAEKAARSARGH